MVYSASKEGMISLLGEAGVSVPSEPTIPENEMAPSASFEFWRPSISDDGHRPRRDGSPVKENDIANDKLGNSRIDLK